MPLDGGITLLIMLMLLFVEHAKSDCGEKDINLIIEEQVIEITKVLDSSIEGRRWQLRWSFHELVDKEKTKCRGANQSRKKSKVQREIDKLAFSFNYD